MVRKLVREISLCYRKFKLLSSLGTAPANGALARSVMNEEELQGRTRK
jgi:hypothetical protein